VVSVMGKGADKTGRSEEKRAGVTRDVFAASE